MERGLDMPKVSVVMAVYNGERYVKQTIDSILRQTFKDFEFIIVDDGSYDGTSKILKTYNDPKIYVHKQENQGLSKSLNTGIKLARGEYIARIDADDIAFPTRLEQQVKFLDEHPKVGLLGTACYLIDSSGKILTKFVMPTNDENIRKAMIKYNPIFHPTVIMRKDAIEKAGYYDETFKNGLDYDLWFKIAKIYKIANLKDPLILRREHNKSLSAREREQVSERIRILIKVVREGTYPPWCSVYIIGQLFMHMLPRFVKTYFRKIIRRKGEIVRS